MQHKFDKQKVVHDPCDCEGPCVYDDDTWRLFYRDVAPKFYRYLFSKLQDHQDTDDVLHEVVLAALMRILEGNYDLRRPLWPYMWAIARNVLMNLLRSRYIDRKRLSEINPEEIHHSHYQMSRYIEDSIEQLDDVAYLIRVGDLTDLEAEVFTLKIINGLTYKQIAFVVGCSPSAAKSTIARAYMKIKKGLRLAGIEDDYWK